MKNLLDALRIANNICTDTSIISALAMLEVYNTYDTKAYKHATQLLLHQLRVRYLLSQILLEKGKIRDKHARKNVSCCRFCHTFTKKDLHKNKITEYEKLDKEENQLNEQLTEYKEILNQLIKVMAI